jgi:hypothetical protein
MFFVREQITYYYGYPNEKSFAIAPRAAESSETMKRRLKTGQRRESEEKLRRRDAQKRSENYKD